MENPVGVFKSNCVTVVFDPKTSKIRLYAGADEVYSLKSLILNCDEQGLNVKITLDSSNKYMFKEESDKLKSVI